MAEYTTLADYSLLQAPKTRTTEGIGRERTGFSRSRDESELDSQALNDVLEKLGHGSQQYHQSNDELIKTKPQLVMQTKKSGNTKQGRKKYRSYG